MSVTMRSRAVPSIDSPWSAVLLLVLLAAEALMIAAQTQVIPDMPLPPNPNPHLPQATRTFLHVGIGMRETGTGTPMLGIVVALSASIQSATSSG